MTNNIANLLTVSIQEEAMQKISSMDKHAVSRAVKYLKELLKTKQISKIYDATEAMAAKGALPRGKYIGKAPFRGEENTIHLWTGGMPTKGGVSTLGTRGIDPSLMVEKSPIMGGLHTSPQKHKATIKMYRQVAEDASLAEDFLPFVLRTTPNAAVAKRNPEYSERIFQPFVPGASSFQDSDAAALAAPLFRRGKLNAITPETALSKLKEIVKSAPVKSNTLDITDLKPDNFVSFGGKVQLADATPSKWINESALSKRISESNPLSTRHAVRSGRLLNPGLFMEGTPAADISGKLISRMRVPVLKDILSSHASAYRLLKASPLSIGDVVTSAGTNTRILQNLAYAASESGNKMEGIMSTLKQLASELKRGARPLKSLEAMPKFNSSLTSEENKLLMEYMSRRSGVPFDRILT